MFKNEFAKPGLRKKRNFVADVKSTCYITDVAKAFTRLSPGSSLRMGNQLYAVDLVIVVVYSSEPRCWQCGSAVVSAMCEPTSSATATWRGGSCSMSIVATETSTVTFLSIPGVALPGPSGNLTFLQLAFGYIIGRVLIAWLLLPQYLRGELFSAYQLLKRAVRPVRVQRTASGAVPRHAHRRRRPAALLTASADAAVHRLGHIYRHPRPGRASRSSTPISAAWRRSSGPILCSSSSTSAGRLIAGRVHPHCCRAAGPSSWRSMRRRARFQFIDLDASPDNATNAVGRV